MNITGAFYALFAFAIFSTHDVVIKFLGGSYAPFQIIFFSTLFSFPLVMFMLIRDRSPGHLRPVHPWWTLFRTLAAMIKHHGRLLCLFHPAAGAGLCADLCHAAGDHRAVDPGSGVKMLGFTAGRR